MNAKAYPLFCTPFDNELFTSFLARNAALLGLQPSELLMDCFEGQPGFENERGIAGARFMIDPPTGAVELLAQRFTSSAPRIERLFLKVRWPHIERDDLSGPASRSLDGRKMNHSGRLNYSWCPACLLEDRAGGRDHHLRQDWVLASATICRHHKRPLNTHCGNPQCYGDASAPICVRIGSTQVYCCPHCETPLDGQLGVDFVTLSNARYVLSDPRARRLYRKLARWEQQLQDAVFRRDRKLWKRRRVGEALLTACNLLLVSVLSSRRAIDCYEHLFIQAPFSTSKASRDLPRPFSAARLVDRRKALALVLAVLENRFDDLGFVQSNGTLASLAEALTDDRYEQFQRQIYEIARLVITD